MITGMITGYTTSTDNTTFGTTGDFNGTTTTTSLIWNQWGGEVTIESFEFKETEDGNFIEVVKREKPNPNVTLTIWPAQEQVDKVYKEIYGVMTKDGRKVLELIKTIEGNVSPGHYVDESIDFDE